MAVEGGGETVRVRPANLSAEPEGAASISAPMLRARTIAARPANAPHGAPKKLVAGGASSAAGDDAARQSSRRERDGESGPPPEGGARWARWKAVHVGLGRRWPRGNTATEGWPVYRLPVDWGRLG